MLRRASDMQRSFTIQAADGDIGRLDQFYFDDQRWLVRYLVIDTLDWLEGQSLLLPPLTIKSISWSKRILHVGIARNQVKNSPDFDHHKPVSRQHETEYSNYYDWPYYWSTAGLWEFGYRPSSLMMSRAIKAAQEHELRSEPGDPHLRSSREVFGYHIKALDGEIGHVEDFIIDDLRWSIEQLVVDTRNWWHGKNVLISPDKIVRINWAEANVDVKLTQNQIKNLADFDGSPSMIRNSQATRSPELF